MRKIVWLSALLAALLAVPGAAYAGGKGGDGDRFRQRAGIELHVGGRHGARFHHRRGPDVWYYRPGRPAHIVPWPHGPRHGFFKDHRHKRFLHRGFGHKPFLHGPRTLAVVPLHAVLGRLRHHFASISHAGRHGDVYVITARDHFGRKVEVVVNPRTGHIIDRKIFHW